MEHIYNENTVNDFIQRYVDTKTSFLASHKTDDYRRNLYYNVIDLADGYDLNLDKQIGRTPYYWIDAFKIVEEDVTAKSVFEKRKNALLSKNIVVYIDDKYEIIKDKKAKEHAIRVIDETMSRIDGYNLINTLLDSIVYGISVVELKWEKKGERYILVDWRQIDPRRIRKDLDLTTKYTTDMNNWEGEYIPKMKHIEMTYNSRGGRYQYGYGVGRTLLKTILDKAIIEGFQRESCALDGKPKFILRTKSSNEKVIETKGEIVENILNSAGGVLSEGDSIESLPHNAPNPELYGKAIDRIEREIYSAFLGESQTTELGKYGSYSSAKISNEIRIEAVSRDARDVSNVLRKQLFSRIIENEFSGDYPDVLIPHIKFVFPDEESRLEERETEREEKKAEENNGNKSMPDKDMKEEGKPTEEEVEVEEKQKKTPSMGMLGKKKDK